MALGSNHGKRRIGSPAGLCRAAGHEETAEHDHAADKVHPIAGHVEHGERHVLRSDLQRHQIIPERAHRQRYHAKEDHDCAVHRAELVVEFRRHYPAGHARFPEQVRQKGNRQRLAGIGQLPAHQQPQTKNKPLEDAVGGSSHPLNGRTVTPGPPYSAGFENLNSTVLASPSPTLIFWTCSPYFSCQAATSYSPAGRPFNENAPSSPLTLKKGLLITPTYADIHGCTSHLKCTMISGSAKVRMVFMSLLGWPTLNSLLFEGMA